MSDRIDVPPLVRDLLLWEGGPRFGDLTNEQLARLAALHPGDWAVLEDRVEGLRMAPGILRHWLLTGEG